MPDPALETTVLAREIARRERMIHAALPKERPTRRLAGVAEPGSLAVSPCLAGTAPPIHVGWRAS